MNDFATSASLFFMRTSSTTSCTSSTDGITFGVKCLSSSFTAWSDSFFDSLPSFLFTESMALPMVISIFLGWNGSMLPSRFLTLCILPITLFLDFNWSMIFKTFDEKQLFYIFEIISESSLSSNKFSCEKH